MTDQNFYENDHDHEDCLVVRPEDGQVVGEIHEGTLTVSHVEVSDLTANQVEVSDLTANQVTETNLSDNRTHADDGEKPEWSHSEHHVLSPYRHNFTVDSGPEVEFINRTFGVDSDKYTEETVAEVRSWQDRKGLKNTGHVTFADYQNL